jgi:hypothetical protein
MLSPKCAAVPSHVALGGRSTGSLPPRRPVRLAWWELEPFEIPHRIRKTAPRRAWRRAGVGGQGYGDGSRAPRELTATRSKK